VLDEDRAQRYRLQDRDCRELLFDLAGIGAAGDILRNARAFVMRYGLLWHGPSDLGSGECRESFRVGWFKHIQDLHLTMTLYQELKKPAQTGSSERLGRWLTAGVSRHEAEQIAAEGPRRFAHRLVANTITKGLEGCGVGVGPNVDLDSEELGRFALSFVPPDLVGVAYAELAMLVGTGDEIKTCPGCGRPFSPVSGKQKYHAPACSNGNRQRRWKEKQAEV
jgi:hypothetical protein